MLDKPAERTGTRVPRYQLFQALSFPKGLRYCLGTGKPASVLIWWQEDCSQNCHRLSWWERGSTNVKAFVDFRGLRLPKDSLVVSLFARCFAKWKVWPTEAEVAIAVLAGVLCPWRFGRPEVLSKQPIDYRHYRLPVGRRAVQVQRCGEAF
jgi:hypothetical protein